MACGARHEAVCEVDAGDLEDPKATDKAGATRGGYGGGGYGNQGGYGYGDYYGDWAGWGYNGYDYSHYGKFNNHSQKHYH